MISTLAARLLGTLAVSAFSAGVGVAHYIAPDYGDLSYLQASAMAAPHSVGGDASGRATGDASAQPACTTAPLAASLSRPIQPSAVPTITLTASTPASCGGSAGTLGSVRVQLEASSDARTWTPVGHPVALGAALTAHGSAVRDLDLAAAPAGACSLRARLLSPPTAGGATAVLTAVVASPACR